MGLINALESSIPKAQESQRMSKRLAGPEILRLIELIARLPGLGPRSARRITLFLLKRQEVLLRPLAEALNQAVNKIHTCQICGNYDTLQPCSVCQSTDRDATMLCIVEDVSDLWALERSGVFRGYYHLLGGVLSAIDGIGPEDLNIAPLLRRIETGNIEEVILALSATVDGQTTAHYLADRLANTQIKITRLAHGVPIGGELEYLDDGTLATALRSRRPL